MNVGSLGIQPGVRRPIRPPVGQAVKIISTRIPVDNRVVELEQKVADLQREHDLLVAMVNGVIGE